MALVRADEPEPQDQVPAGLSLSGLAEDWESDLGIRHRARQLGSLLNWGEPNKVGIPSMILILILILFWDLCYVLPWEYVLGFPIVILYDTFMFSRHGLLISKGHRGDQR